MTGTSKTMTASLSLSGRGDVLGGVFGFDPRESSAHFLIHVPSGSTLPVSISDHLSWDPERVGASVHLGADRGDGQVRCQLARAKWNEIAEPVRAEFNARLRREEGRPGKWRVGHNPVSRLFGKELTLLAWAIEDADPALIPTALANWHGLSPEERWWLYTMTAAATGHAVTGRNRGWRTAVRFALTDNPVNAHAADRPQVPEYFRLACQEEVTRKAGNDAQVEDVAAPVMERVHYEKPPRPRTSRRKLAAR